MLKQLYAVTELKEYDTQDIDFLKQLFASPPQVFALQKILF